MSRAPVVYCAAFDDPADWLDLAFLVRSPDHDLRGVFAPESVDFAGFESAAGVAVDRLDRPWADAPANVIAAGRFGPLADTQRDDPSRFRGRTLRLFLVGGHARTLPIDPRLRERHPERFAESGDPRVDDPAALEDLLRSGEAVIWLPRDICLWRYAAPQILEIGADDLTRWLVGRVEAALGPGEAVLLSSAPAFCLSVYPDPTLWLRLFRASAARLDATLSVPSPNPNLFVVAAIDGFALGKWVTARLRASAEAETR